MDARRLHPCLVIPFVTLALVTVFVGPARGGTFVFVPRVAFTSTRDHATVTPPFNGGEIYLMAFDGSDARRLTFNDAGDGFPTLSPDGKKIVFDSNRNRTPSEALNTSDLFLMETDGAGQTFLTRGSSATWSPNGKLIAFHASASGTGRPLRPDPGSATSDSDIFVVNVDDLLAGTVQPINLTNSQDEIDDDADWSPDGERIVYTAHDVGDDPASAPFLSNTAEIFTIQPDGTDRVRLTDNEYEERAPAWSPDGERIVFMCRIDGGATDFEICVMDLDDGALTQLTDNAAPDATPCWSPDGQTIVFHRPVPGTTPPLFELFRIDPDGIHESQLTDTPGLNGFANCGELRTEGGNGGPA